MIRIQIYGTLFLVFQLVSCSQDSKITVADNYFKEEKYIKALNFYEKTFNQQRFTDQQTVYDTTTKETLGEDVLRVIDHQYEYFYLLFKIAECKRLLNDTTSHPIYEKILDHYSKIGSMAYVDNRVLLLIAECLKNLNEYEISEQYYNDASNEFDSIPDNFKLGYAFVSMKNNRFGQSLHLLQEIKNKKAYQPELNRYKNICKSGLSKSVSRSIQINDTLNIFIDDIFCHITHKKRYDVIRLLNDFKVIVYQNQTYLDTLGWEIDHEHNISKNSYRTIIDFEERIRKYNEYTNKKRCSRWAYYYLTTKDEEFQMQINDCAKGISQEVEDILNKDNN